MSDNISNNRYSGTATVILLSLVLFYSPTAIAIFNHAGEPSPWKVMGIMMATFYTIIFVVNYFWLVPATLVRNDSKAIFLLVNFCIIVIVCSLIPIWFETHGGMPRPRHIDTGTVSLGRYLLGYLGFLLRDGIMMVLAVALAYALRLSKEHENVRRQELELNAEKQKIEIRSLKAQLNPHFLFNTFNNIYALIGFAPDRAQQALHDLSNMLRFMIYDSALPYVSVEKELHFISDYVELMRLRCSSNQRLDCNINFNAAPGGMIAPLLFLTLVENAFKHAAPNDSDNFINISIDASDGNLVCRVENSCNNDDSQTAAHTDHSPDSGVGLANVRRQLGLIYPGHYNMTVNHNRHSFLIEVGISLSSLNCMDTAYRTI